MKNFIKTYRQALLTLLLVAVLLTVAASPFPAPTKFRQVLVESTLQVLGATTTTGLTNVGTLTNAGVLTQVGAMGVTGDSILTGALSVTGAETVGTFEIYTAAPVITVTMSVPITATGSYQPLAAAGSVNTTLAVAAAGTRVCYVNTVAQNIVITDTTTTMLTGNLTLNQYDTLCVISDGTNMIELSTSNN